MARPKTKKRASKKLKNRRGGPSFAYPLVLFLLLCVGVFLVGWTFKASGADIKVTAAVHAPAVTDPAVITSPINGQHFKTEPITVTGTCPANASYVEIFRNNLMSGSALCDGSGNFQLTVSIYSGRNDLIAHVFNITDDEGPVSSTVTVYYDAPKPPPSQPSSGTGNQPSGGGTAASTPLILTTSFLYKGFYIGQKVDWPLRITGGTGPYALNVNWGDGQNDVISRNTAGDFSIGHTYSSSGDYKHSFTIKVSAADKNGQKAYLQFFVIVNSKSSAGLAGNIFTKPPPECVAYTHGPIAMSSLSCAIQRIFSKDYWLWVAWPVYLLVIAMLISYWLGEKEELLVLRKKGQLKR